MALKDLVADSDHVAEEAIEAVVKDFVRYDVKRADISFTPEFNRLGSKAKLLVYLVAVEGWRFVTEGVSKPDVKPSLLEAKLSIPGGTIRPLLRDLADAHLVASDAGSYSVRLANLDAVARAIAGEHPRGVRSRAATRKRPSRAQSPEEHTDSQEDRPQTARKKVVRSSDGPGERFKSWLQEGYFDAGRTLSDVQSRFHEEAIIIPQTSIPKYLLKAVRDRQLVRKKEQVSGKERWVYRSISGATK